MGQGKLLEDLSWTEAESALSEQAIVVIPLGAAAKQHGPHLKLNNDLLLADYFKSQLIGLTECVIAPSLSYFYYPSFVEYPGSISLSKSTARDIVVETCRCLSNYGPRRFYVINTGVSTVKALNPAQKILSTSGLLLHYSNWEKLVAAASAGVSEQEGGSHADEVETSIMLYIAEGRVEMPKAKKDFHPAAGRLTRQRQPGKTYSPTGIFGDPTLASAAKGERIVKSLLAGMLSEIEGLRQTALPQTG